MRLIAVSVAWIAGIYLGSLVAPPVYSIVSASIVSVLAALLFRRSPVLLWSALCLVAVLGGIACYGWRISEPTLPDSGFADIEAEVERDPEFGGGAASLRLSARKMKSDSGWEDTSGKVLVYTYGYLPYSQGDLLRVVGELEPLSGIESQDYREYLERSGFRATMSDPQVEFLRSGLVAGVRNRLSDSLTRALSEPQGSLAEALLLGIRSHIPGDLEESFRRSGAAHLLAVSGLHVAMLAGAVLSGAAWLFGRQRPIYLVLAFATIWLYALLTGMRPPAFRAAIMFSLFLAAMWVGRPRSAVPSLTLAAAIMVGISPAVLRDVSFQLSFVAVGGVIAIGPSFAAARRDGVLSWLEAKSWLLSGARFASHAMMVSFAATIAVYPLIAYYFGYVSVVGAPATFLALLALPGAVMLTFLTALLGLFAPPLSLAVGWLAWVFLGYMIQVVRGFGALPFASYELGSMHAGVLWAYYGVLVAVLSRRHWKVAVARPAAWVKERAGGLGRFGGFADHRPRKWAVVPLVVAAAVVWLAVASVPGGKLEVSFLDVGQGDAVLIQTRSGHQVLVDGGPDPERVCLELGKGLPFWDKSLDLVVLTHPDSDHVVGLVEVLRRYEVDRVMDPGVESDNDAYEGWLSLVEQRGIERTVAVAGQHIDLGDGVAMEVLHPQQELMQGTQSDVNNNSVVVRLVWKEVSFLLTGDIYEEAERDILYGGSGRDSTVLKVAHHGGAGSSCAHFLAAADPQAAVICVGADNTFGHPDEETLARLDGVPVYRTDEHGTVTFTTDGERLWVGTER